MYFNAILRKIGAHYFNIRIRKTGTGSTDKKKYSE